MSELAHLAQNRSNVKVNQANVGPRICELPTRRGHAGHEPRHPKRGAHLALTDLVRRRCRNP